MKNTAKLSKYYIQNSLLLTFFPSSQIHAEIRDFFFFGIGAEDNLFGSILIT